MFKKGKTTMSLTGTEVLTQHEADVLKFILDTTVERWGEDNDKQIQYMADDPSLTSLDDMLETTQFLSELPNVVLAIRNKLFPGRN